MAHEQATGYAAVQNDIPRWQGPAKEGGKVVLRIRDHLDTVRRLPAFTSRAASEEMGRHLVALVAYHKGSGGQTDPALTPWLMGPGNRFREKLVAIGLLAPPI